MPVIDSTTVWLVPLLFEIRSVDDVSSARFADWFDPPATLVKVIGGGDGGDGAPQVMLAVGDPGKRQTSIWGFEPTVSFTIKSARAVPKVPISNPNASRLATIFDFIIALLEPAHVRHARSAPIVNG